MAKRSKKVKDLEFWTIEEYANEHNISKSTARYRLEALLKTGKWQKNKEDRYIDFENPHPNFGGRFIEVNVYEQLS